ncbi:MAG: transporter [Desulfuromonas sp.]|uniref:OmpP1/FadL family transporter n=1 Tax=Desulfuromonas sp. TaxID=892 RepID=UPI000CB49999|nr:outer membrane protein transport protein [Desulfuromonas sp.]PLX84590.1 MAG: transporter [Desulfuromonas sp.]
MNRRWAKKRNCFVIFLAVLFFSAAQAHSSGYAVYTHGAAALGQGNAVTAHGSDPSVVFFNPALLNGLEGTQVLLGTTLIFPSREFESDLSGRRLETDSTVFTPSTLYISHKLNEQFSAGLGVFNPFGLGTKWDEDWEGRYITTESTLKTFNINPALSYRVAPRLTLAAGLDILLLDATLEKRLKSSSLGIPLSFDIGQKFDGDGTGLGYNLGLALRINDDFTFGASYRSKVEVDIEGEATFTFPAGLPDGIPSGKQPPVDGKSDITLPQQFHAGICYEGLEDLTLETGLRWEGWSDFERLKIALETGQTDTTDRDWKDVFAYNIGARYRLSPGASVLAGYLYGNTPVPDKTFDPTIPDSDAHVFSIGSELTLRRFKVAASYAYQLFEDRKKKNAVPLSSAEPIDKADGSYESDLHMLGASVTYLF